MDSNSELESLRREMGDLKRNCFIASAIVLLAALFWNLLPLADYSDIEMRYEDMFGSRDKLPLLTHLMMGYARAAAGWLPTILVCSLGSITWLLMKLNRHSFRFVVVAVSAITILVAHRRIRELSIEIPQTQLMNGPMSHTCLKDK